MDPEVREALVTAGICTGIVYFVFLIGWLFRSHLGVPKINLKAWWTFLLVAPLAFVGVLVVRAALPEWARGIFIGVLGVVLLWAEARFVRAPGKGHGGAGTRSTAVGDR